MPVIEAQAERPAQPTVTARITAMQAFLEELYGWYSQIKNLPPASMRTRDPSVFHVPWVTLKFLLTTVLFGERGMTPARWNNVLAPILLPFVGFPLGPIAYYIDQCDPYLNVPSDSPPAIRGEPLAWLKK